MTRKVVKKERKVVKPDFLNAFFYGMCKQEEKKNE